MFNQPFPKSDHTKLKHIFEVEWFATLFPVSLSDEYPYSYLNLYPRPSEVDLQNLDANLGHRSQIIKNRGFDLSTGQALAKHTVVDFRLSYWATNKPLLRHDTFSSEPGWIEYFDLWDSS
ncbi:hypothetical protein Tco_0070701 [Tanacetum coccineum]